MTGRESEIPTSVSAGGGGGGGTRTQEERRRDNEEYRAELRAREALETLGISMDQVAKRQEAILQRIAGGARSGAAPDFTSRGVESRIDPWLSTGGGLDEAQFYYRKLALTDPTAYEEARTAALTKIKESIQTTFDTTLTQYQSAGYSIQDSEVKALEAAKASREIQMKALATKFGMNDSLYMEGAHKGAAAFKLGR